MADELFNDGVANAGSVFRRGDEVIRPAGPHSIAVHLLLRHLRAVGFNGAPVAIAIENSVERVSYISGEVPAPPYTPWSLSDDNIYRIAGLQRAYHEAVRTFVPPPHSFWNTGLADPEGKGIIAHNDMGPGNIVFRNQEPIGFIDFDFAAPGRALWDVARAARTWVPLDDPASAATYGLGGLNPLSRFKVFCDGYGLDRQKRSDLVNLLNLCNAVSEAFVRQEYNAGKPAFVRMWNEYRLDELYAKRRKWIKSNIENLRAAATQSVL